VRTHADAHCELTPKEPKIHTGCNHRAWHACKPGQMHISPSASPMTHHMLSQQHRLQSSKSYISLAPFGRNAPLPPAPGARRRASCSRREHSVSGPSASTAPRTHRPRAAIGDLTHHRRHASFMIPDAHLTSFTSPPPSLPTAALLPHTCRTRAAHVPHTCRTAYLPHSDRYDVSLTLSLDPTLTQPLAQASRYAMRTLDRAWISAPSPRIEWVRHPRLPSPSWPPARTRPRSWAVGRRGRRSWGCQ